MKTGWTNLVFVVLSTAFSLLCAEMFVRQFSPQQLAIWHNTRNGIVIHPPNSSTYITEFKQKIQFNSYGMRDREHSVEHRGDALRILVLGDSFMEALQVAFEDSFPSLLEMRLRQALNRNVEVINCSVSGWGTDVELAYLARYGRVLQPDLILVAVTLHNDVQENMKEQFHTVVEAGLLRKPIQEIPLLEYGMLRVKGFLSSHSHLVQLVRKYRHSDDIAESAKALDNHVLQLIQKDDPSQLKKGWTLTFQLLKEIHESGRKLGAETAVILIPLAIQLYDNALADFLARFGMSRDDISIGKPQRTMQEFAREARMEVIDLLPSFRERVRRHQTPLHLEEGHWNEYGQRLATDIVVKELIERHLVAPEKPLVYSSRKGNKQSDNKLLLKSD